jgi:hypothetical protein
MSHKQQWQRGFKTPRVPEMDAFASSLEGGQGHQRKLSAKQDTNTSFPLKRVFPNRCLLEANK